MLGVAELPPAAPAGEPAGCPARLSALSEAAVAAVGGASALPSELALAPGGSAMLAAAELLRPAGAATGRCRACASAMESLPPAAAAAAGGSPASPPRGLASLADAVLLAAAEMPPAGSPCAAPPRGLTPAADSAEELATAEMPPTSLATAVPAAASARGFSGARVSSVLPLLSAAEELADGLLPAPPRELLPAAAHAALLTIADAEMPVAADAAMPAAADAALPAVALLLPPAVDAAAGGATGETSASVLLRTACAATRLPAGSIDSSPSLRLLLRLSSTSASCAEVCPRFRLGVCAATSAPPA